MAARSARFVVTVDLPTRGVWEAGTVGGQMRVEPGALVGLAARGDTVAVSPPADPPSVISVEQLRSLDQRIRPRWVVWSADELASAAAGVGLGRCWDVAAVHRLRHGGWSAPPGAAWAWYRGVDPADVPQPVEPDLFTPADAGDPDRPRRLSRSGRRLRHEDGGVVGRSRFRLRSADGLPG